ncbi:hypothetical protein R2F25_04475 [Streptomyces sp. UP1A-1]|nr:hypothetical protein [Streptomyces sp. UP1A-1]
MRRHDPRGLLQRLLAPVLPHLPDRRQAVGGPQAVPAAEVTVARRGVTRRAASPGAPRRRSAPRSGRSGRCAGRPRRAWCSAGRRARGPSSW